MRNRNRKRLVIFVGLTALIASLFGCNKKNTILEIGEKGTDGAGKNAVVNKTKLTGFEYSYSNSFLEGSYHYTLKKSEEGTVTLSYENLSYDYGELSIVVEEDVLERLNQIYLDQNLASWDGYDKYNPNVMDGDGFSVRFAFEDGVKQSAHGSNCVPEGYRAFVNSMEEVLKPYAKSILEKGRTAKIEKGVNGRMESLFMTIIQHGSSGSDEYHITLSRDDGEYNNVDITIKSVSGEFFETGKYRYYAKMPDDAIFFDRFNELIDKYNMTSWMDFEGTDEDYTNKEWFQLHFIFEEGSIGAYGTAYPENYREFRNDFLTVLSEMIKTDIEQYGLTLYE